MKLFDRLNKNRAETVPAEVQDYYRSERRERTGLAWLLALGTLIVTVLIAAGLFYGGRWVYRKVAGTGATTSTTQQQEQGETSSANTEQSTVTETPGGGQSQQNQPAAATQHGQQPQGGGAPATQTAPQTLVNTGPDPELEQEQ